MDISKLQAYIHTGLCTGQITNEDLLQIIQQCGAYLNLQTISAYSKNNNISYNGARNFRKVVSMFGVKFIIDND